jgi:hypothetical protein
VASKGHEPTTEEAETERGKGNDERGKVSWQTKLGVQSVDEVRKGCRVNIAGTRSYVISRRSSVRWR